MSIDLSHLTPPGEREAYLKEKWQQKGCLDLILAHAKSDQEDRTQTLTHQYHNTSLAAKSLGLLAFRQLGNALEEMIHRIPDGRLLQKKLEILKQEPSYLSHAYSKKDADVVGIQANELRKELERIRPMSVMEYARCVYLPERIQKDLDKENIEALKAWLIVCPQYFSGQELVMKIVRLVNSRGDLVRSRRDKECILQAIKVLGSGIHEIVDDIREELSLLATRLIEEPGHLPIVEEFFYTKKPILNKDSFGAILRFGIDTNKVDFVSKVLDSEQGLWIQEGDLQRAYPRVNNKFKKQIENLWLVRNKDLSGLLPPSLMKRVTLTMTAVRETPTVGKILLLVGGLLGAMVPIGLISMVNQGLDRTLPLFYRAIP